MVCIILFAHQFFNGRNIFWTGLVSGELLHSEPASYQGCGACEPQSSSLWTAALTCDNAIQADQSAISWWSISESADHFISQLLWEAPELSLVLSSGCNSVLEPFGSNHLSKLRLRFCFQPASSWSAFPADQSAWQLHSIHLAWPRSVKYLAGTWQVLDKYLAISCSVPDMNLANTWPSNVQLILQPLSPVVHIVPEPRLWYCNSYIKSLWSLSSDFIIERKIIVIVIIPIPSTNVHPLLTSQPTQPNPVK